MHEQHIDSQVEEHEEAVDRYGGLHQLLSVEPLIEPGKQCVWNQPQQGHPGVERSEALHIIRHIRQGKDCAREPPHDTDRQGRHTDAQEARLQPNAGEPWILCTHSLRRQGDQRVTEALPKRDSRKSDDHLRKGSRGQLIGAQVTQNRDISDQGGKAEGQG